MGSRTRNPPPHSWDAHLGSRMPPPPPCGPPTNINEAKVAAMAVMQHTLSTTSTWRTMAQDYALSLPRTCTTPEEWVRMATLKSGRHEHIVKAGLVMALNPGCTCTWASEQVGRQDLKQYVVRGLALNVRFHPFTRPELVRVRDKLSNYKGHAKDARQIRAARLDAAVTLLSIGAALRFRHNTRA